MVARGRQVSTSTIDNLTAALTRLKESDCDEAGLREGGFWVESSELDRIRSTKSLEDQARGVRACISELSDVRKALDILRFACQDRLGSLRDEFAGTINKAGLLGLPNEILQAVLTEAAKGEEILPGKKTFAISVSQVCRRLRECAHHTPDLWCLLSNNMHPLELEHRVARAQNRLLGIELHATNLLGPPANTEESLRIMGGVKDQWLSFSFKCCDHNSWAIKAHLDFLRVLNKYLLDLELPELQSLHIIDITGRDIFSEEEVNVFDFYETWEMPNLSHFDSAFNLPRRVMSESIWKRLESASLWISACSEDVDGLLQFLGLCPTLREMTLKVGNPISGVSHNVGLPKWNTVALRKLKSLELIATDPYSIVTIQRRLITPAVERLALDIRYDPTNAFTERYLMDTFAAFESLMIKDLEVRLHTTVTVEFDVVSNILSRYKNLSRLSIEAPDTEIHTEFPRERWMEKLPPLRTVSFRNCTKLNPAFIGNLVAGLDSRPLEIVQPPILNKEVIENSAFRDKLAWYQSSGYSKQISTYDFEPSDTDSLIDCMPLGTSDNYYYTSEDGSEA